MLDKDTSRNTKGLGIAMKKGSSEVSSVWKRGGAAGFSAAMIGAIIVDDQLTLGGTLITEMFRASSLGGLIGGLIGGRFTI